MMGVDYLPPMRPGISVRDVGCGIGAAVRQVSGNVRPGLVVGLDRSHGLVARAKTGDESIAENLGLLLGDAVELPFRENRFDLVFSQMTLAWVGDVAGAAGEQVRVARSGGIVAAVDVDFDAALWYPELPAFRKTRAAYCRLWVR
jgi:ubiquinone/menaquinone biosynthesis C-methylase UbiE